MLKRLIEKRNEYRNKGFTLQEVLVVVAITVVLLALVTIAIFSYLRTLYQFKLDAVAKEIFISAQNHLSMSDGENFLGRTSFGNEEDGDKDGIYYYVVPADDPDSETSVLNLLLPFGAIDEDVRDNSFIIRYQKDPAMVLDVFYAEPNNRRFGHTFTKDEYSTLISGYRGDEKKVDRRNYTSTKRVIGYYGGVDADAMKRNNKFKAPKIEVVNGEKLYVVIDNYVNFGQSPSLKLLISGANGSKEIKIVENGVFNGDSKIIHDDANYRYTVILDDITTAGLGFAEQFGDVLVPGENIKIKAVAYSNTEYTNIANSGTKTTNSLYGDYDGTDTVEIGNIRHLENLYKEISDVSVNVDNAKQTTDIYWNSNDSIFNDSCKIYGSNGATILANGSFVPVEVESEKFSYDGNGDHAINGVVIDTDERNGGLFSELNNATVKDVRLVDFDVYASAGTAGALVGSATNTEISGVIAYNNNDKSDTALEIVGNGCTGGLVGYMQGGSIDKSAAAVYVKSTGADAGGLVGYLSSGDISYSYSGGHTNNARYVSSTTGKGRYNVIASDAAGGLVGRAANGYKIISSYTTSSAYSSASNVGGFIGNSSNGEIKNSFSTGLSERKNGLSGNFVGATSSSVFEDCYYLNGISPNAKTETISGIRPVSANDTTSYIFPDNAHKSAIVYDNTLISEYNGKFSFKTIEQLAGIVGVHGGINDRHYGDWQMPMNEPLEFVFKNDDTLRLEIPLELLDEKFVIAVTGEESDYTKIFNLEYDGTNVTLTAEGHVEDGVIVYDDSVTTELPIEIHDDEVHIIFDDITKSDRHFDEIFADTELIRGENLDVRMAKNEPAWADIKEMDYESENSLFALSEYGDAHIEYIRHLQNLDPVISNVDDDIARAYLDRNLSFNYAVYNRIYRHDSAKIISGAFYGIYNNRLFLFDGQNHYLDNFKIRGATEMDNTVKGSHNAGLFRYADNGILIKNLKLNDFDVKATGGYAAAAVAETSGAGAILDTVLVTSHDKSIISSSDVAMAAVDDLDPVNTFAAGGLVGQADSSLTIRNSAASVYVMTDGYAGGLVGNKTSNGKLTIENSYAGGHTDEEERNVVYDTDDQANIYATGNDSAGGLVGNISSIYSITNSFSAASVGAEKSTVSAGGVVGSIHENGTMDTVYTVAPVFNVNPGGEATSAGGFIGSIETGKSVTVAASEGESTIFYLPSIYENNIDDNAPYLGNGASDNQLSMDINILHFYVDADGNIISAKGNEETMQKRTFPYDGRLKDTGVQSSKEYPFSVWSTFGFKDNNYRVNNTYYGDWQSIVNEPTETCAIEFYMINPLTGAESKIIDPNLPDQIIIKGQENTVLLPYTNMIPGYYIANWTVKKADNTDSTPIESTDGTLTIPNSLCGTAGDTTTVIKVTAHYLEDKSNLYVTFFYDPSGENTGFEQIGDTKIIKPIPATLYNQIDTPSKEIESYKFIGWFNYDPETGYGTEIDFTSASSIKSNINAYAKYELIKTYTVTIDFMYSLDGGASRYLSSLPRYRLEEVGQYKLNFTEGDIFTGDIPLPDVTFEEGVKLNDITLGKYVLNEETGNVDIVEDLDHARLVDEVIKLSNLNTDCRFVVTYDLDTGEAEETYVYKLIYRYYNTDAETETTWEVATDNYGSQYREKDFDTELTFKRGKWWYETLEDVTKTGKNTDLYKVVAHDRTSPDQYYVFDNGMQLTSGNAKYIQDAWYLVNDTDALYEKYTGTTTGKYFYQDGNEVKSKTLSYDNGSNVPDGKRWYELLSSDVYYEADKNGSSSGTYYIFSNGTMDANTQKITYVNDGWYIAGDATLYQKYTGSTSGKYSYLYNGKMITSSTNLTKKTDGWYINVDESANNINFYNFARNNSSNWETDGYTEYYYVTEDGTLDSINRKWRCQNGIIQYRYGGWYTLDGVTELYSSNNNGTYIFNDDLDEFVEVTRTGTGQGKRYSYSKFVATDVYRKDGSNGVNIPVNGDCYIQDGNNMIAVKKAANGQYKSDKKADTIYYKATGNATAGRKYYRIEDGKLVETPYTGNGQSRDYITSTVYRKDGVSTGSSIAVNAKCYIFKNGSFVEVVKADTNQYKGDKVANEIYEKDTGSSDIGSTRYIEIIDGFTGDVTLQEVTKTGQKAYEYTTQELVEKEYTGTRYKQNTSYQMHYDSDEVLETDLGNYLMKINTEPAFNLIPVTGFTIKDRIIKVEKPGTTEEPWRDEWNSADVVYIIEYERNKYTLSFKSKLGIFADGFENPVSLYFDQPLNSVPHGSNVITRKYYTFDTTKEGSADGWMITNLGNAEPEFTDYTWADRMPYNNLVAYPQWKTNDTANYKIIVWRQKITDDRQLNKDGDNAHKSYDFVFMDSKSGAVGSSVNIDSYKNYSSSDYDGFQYSWTDAGTKTISADNATVINVYYDRKIVTYEFYTDSNYSKPWSDAVYTESTSEEAKYGVVNGEYIELTRKEDGWYYTEAYKAEVETTAEYNGDRYEIITSGYRNNTTYYYNNNGTLSVANYWNGNWYNSNWRQISTPSAIYRRTNPTTGTIYGWDSNEKKFIQLTKSENKYIYAITVEETRYRETKYTGKRYTYGGGQSSPFWGLYGQLLTQYGYQWPSNYKWYYRSSSGNSAGMSYLGQFLSGSDYYGYQQNKVMMRVDNSDGVRYIYFYQQGLDGNYPDTPTDIGAITGGSSGFNFTEKYGNGFHHVQYKINNGNWKSTSSEMGGRDFNTNNILHIRYERNKFEIQYYPVVVNGSSYDVASTPVAKVSAYYDSTIEKNDSLIPEQPSDETYRAQGYAWDGKYYEDQACTVEYAFGKKMPAANVPVYVKYVLPEVKVHFNLIDENAAIKPSDVKYAEAGETEDYTITVTKQDSIEGLITLDDELLPKYSPVTESGEYDFVKWYYYSNGSKKEFYYTQEITEDIELYAEWKVHEDEPEVENINVVVSYMHVDGDGIEHKIAIDTGPIKRAAGTYYIMVCPDIDEYYPKDTICSFPVTKTPSAISNSTYDPETNTLYVKAYYNRVQEWKYQVNLYARYSNYIDDEVPGLTKATNPSEYLIETYLASAYSLYDSVEFVMPSEYSNYHLVEYEYDGNTGSDTVVTIHQDPYLIGTEYKAVINYYIEPDPSLITVDNIDTIYDGTEKANSAPRLDEKNVYRAPNDDTTVTTYDIYTYLNGEGVAISAIDSGSYSASGYVYITVNGNNYLLWKSNKDQLSLRIAKRNVLAISQDLEGYYDANSTLTNDVVDDTTKNDLYQGFVEGEGANYNFSIESFRKDPGSTKNNFDFEFWKKDESLGHKETKAQNYNVVVKFGTLSIYWDYDIESYVVFDNISLEDEEKILLNQFITLADESTYKIDERNDIRARKYDATVDYSFLDGAKFDSYLFDHGTYDGNIETEMRSTVYPYLIGDIYTGKLGLYMKLNTNTENFMIRDASVKPLTPQKQIIANFAYADPLYEEESTEHGVEIVTVMDATDNPVSESIYKNINNTIHVPELADIVETITEDVVIDDTTEPATTEPVTYEVTFEVKYWTVEGDSSNYKFVPDEDGNIVVDAALCAGNVDDETESIKLIAHYGLAEDRTPIDKHVPENEGITVFEVASSYVLPDAPEGTTASFTYCYIPYIRQADDTFIPVPKEMLYSESEEDYAADVFLIMKVEDDLSTKNYVVRKDVSKDIKLKVEPQTEIGE